MRMGKRWCSWGGLSRCLEEEGGCTQLLHLKGGGATNGITSKWDLGVKHPRRKDCPSGSGCVSSAKFTVTHAEGVASKLSGLWPALLLRFETFWLPSLSMSPRLYHFYLPPCRPLYPSSFQPINSTLPCFLLYQAPCSSVYPSASSFTFVHLLLFSIPEIPLVFSRVSALGGGEGQHPQRRLCSPI